MAELAVARLRTIVRLGEALAVVFFSGAVDFILPVNCRRSTTAVQAASGTAGKMNSPEAEAFGALGLECSHQPHIQGRGAKKRTQRAG